MACDSGTTNAYTGLALTNERQLTGTPMAFAFVSNVTMLLAAAVFIGVLEGNSVHHSFPFGRVECRLAVIFCFRRFVNAGRESEPPCERAVSDWS